MENTNKILKNVTATTTNTTAVKKQGTTRPNKETNKNNDNRKALNLPANTVYNTVKYVSAGVFSKKDLRKMANVVRDKYQKRYGKDKEPDRIEQEENGIKYQVFCYPEIMRKEIVNVVRWYYEIKNKTAERHIRTTAKELLDKLQKNNDPRYSIELVKYNLAEIDRQKNKQIKEKTEKKKQNFEKNKRNKKNKFNNSSRNNTQCYNNENKKIQERKSNVSISTNEIEQLKQELNINESGSYSSYIDKATEQLLDNKNI